MTETTAPATPAKRARKPHVAPPAFDYTSVKIVEAEPPARSNGKSKADNPTVKWLEESWAKRKSNGSKNGRETYLGAGAVVTIPTANVQELRNLLNYAARDLGIGVSIRVTPKPGGKSQVNYAAKSRNLSKSKKAATPAAS